MAKSGLNAKAIYSPCKILSLGQKKNWLKHAKNVSKKDIRVVLCKKQLEKTANIRNVRLFWKWSKMATMQRL